MASSFLVAILIKKLWMIVVNADIRNGYKRPSHCLDTIKVWIQSKLGNKSLTELMGAVTDAANAKGRQTSHNQLQTLLNFIVP